MLACLGHDLNHKGVGNSYYISAKHEYALRYCNKSVLENMHAAMLIKLLRKPENDILGTFSPEERKVF